MPHRTDPVPPLPVAMLLDMDDTILAFSDSAHPCWGQVCISFAARLSDLLPDRRKSG